MSIVYVCIYVVLCIQKISISNNRILKNAVCEKTLHSDISCGVCHFE